MRHTVATILAVAGIAIALLVAGSGCEEGSSSNNALATTSSSQDEGVAGTWSVLSGGYTRQMNIVESEGAISGTVVTPAGASYALTGSVTDTSVVLESQDVSGTGSLVGNTMSGTWTRPNGDSGSWIATRD